MGLSTQSSALQLPSNSDKARQFETIRWKTAVKCGSLEPKYDITIEGHSSPIQESGECSNLVWSSTEMYNYNFASIQMTLEHFRLQKEAPKLLEDDVPSTTTSTQEREPFRHLETETFRTVEKLNQLLSFSFFLEILSRRIQIVASEELEPLREAILKTEEIINTFQERLVSDHKLSKTHFDELDARFCDSKWKVESLFKDSLFFEGGHLPIEDIIRPYASTENRICFALGLEIDYLDSLELSSDEMTFRLSIPKWILNSLNNKFREIDDKGLKKNLSKELLMKLGFRTNSKAIQTIMSRSASLSGHVEPVELAKRFVKDELKYNPVFSEEVSRFPLIDRAQVHYKVKSSENLIDVINVERDDARENLGEEYIAKHIDGLSDVDSVILFHGTDHHSALDILHDGIDVYLGRHKRDFSDGRSFYLTNDYKHSKTWSFTNSRKPAVLIFKVAKSFIEEPSTLDLSGEERKDEWLKVVSACRSGRRSKKLRDRLKTYNIIKGPMSEPSDDMERPFKQKADLQQFCIINQDCADEMRGFLKTIIFYD